MSRIFFLITNSRPFKTDLVLFQNISFSSSVICDSFGKAQLIQLLDAPHLLTEHILEIKEDKDVLHRG